MVLLVSRHDCIGPIDSLQRFAPSPAIHLSTCSTLNLCRSALRCTALWNRSWIHAKVARVCSYQSSVDGAQKLLIPKKIGGLINENDQIWYLWVPHVWLAPGSCCDLAREAAKSCVSPVVQRVSSSAWVFRGVKPSNNPVSPLRFLEVPMEHTEMIYQCFGEFFRLVQ